MIKKLCVLAAAFYAVIILTLAIAFSGTNDLPIEVGPVIRKTHINKFQLALVGDNVPRNTLGVATTLEGSLGTTALEWLKAFIASGYWDCGDVKYNLENLGSVGQGWMLADGSTVGAAAYDAHPGRSAGDFVTFVGTACIVGALPDLDNDYLVGETTLAQSGDAIGNASHQINLLHAHTSNSHTHTNSHNHKWYNNNGTGTADETFDSGGSLIILPSGAQKTSTVAHIIRDLSAALPLPMGDSFTDNQSTNTSTASDSGMNNQLSATQSIQPRSVKAIPYIRIID